MSYRVDVTEVAEAEIEAAYFSMIGFAPASAGDWYSGLLTVLESLAEMPHRFAVVPFDAADPDDIRVMLYGRRSNTYRVLFRIVDEAQPEGEDGLVRVLHVVHASRLSP